MSFVAESQEEQFQCRPDKGRLSIVFSENASDFPENSSIGIQVGRTCKKINNLKVQL